MFLSYSRCIVHRCHGGVAMHSNSKPKTIKLILNRQKIHWVRRSRSVYVNVKRRLLSLFISGCFTRVIWLSTVEASNCSEAFLLVFGERKQNQKVARDFAPIRQWFCDGRRTAISDASYCSNIYLCVRSTVSSWRCKNSWHTMMPVQMEWKCVGRCI